MLMHLVFELQHSAMTRLSEGEPDSCRPAEPVCFRPKGAVALARTAQFRPIAAFSAGLFGMLCDLLCKTIAYDPCYTCALMLSGKTVRIKQS